MSPVNARVEVKVEVSRRASLAANSLKLHAIKEKMSAVVNVEKFYERLNKIHAHFVKHR